MKDKQSTWRERKHQFAQAILVALEYRGFYDCGKYLDDTIFESIEPLITEVEAGAEQRERERIEKKIPSLVPYPQDANDERGKGEAEGFNICISHWRAALTTPQKTNE